MPVTIRAVLLVLAMSLTLTACGGGGGSDGGNNQPPPPVDTTLDWDEDNWDEKDWV